MQRVAAICTAKHPFHSITRFDFSHSCKHEQPFIVAGVVIASVALRTSNSAAKSAVAYFRMLCAEYLLQSIILPHWVTLLRPLCAAYF
jgi:hypothetical protein